MARPLELKKVTPDKSMVKHASLGHPAMIALASSRKSSAFGMSISPARVRWRFLMGCTWGTGSRSALVAPDDSGNFGTRRDTRPRRGRSSTPTGRHPPECQHNYAAKRFGVDGGAGRYRPASACRSHSELRPREYPYRFPARGSWRRPYRRTDAGSRPRPGVGGRRLCRGSQPGLGPVRTRFIGYPRQQAWPSDRPQHCRFLRDVSWRGRHGGEQGAVQTELSDPSPRQRSPTRPRSPWPQESLWPGRDQCTAGDVLRVVGPSQFTRSAQSPELSFRTEVAGGDLLPGFRGLDHIALNNHGRSAKRCRHRQ